MDFVKILTEPAILIITAFFLFFTIYVLIGYVNTEKYLKSVFEFLSGFNKKELSYRFNEIDEFMTNNSYTTTIWEDFKKALVFPDKLYAANQTIKATTSADIYLN